MAFFVFFIFQAVFSFGVSCRFLFRNGVSTIYVKFSGICKYIFFFLCCHETFIRYSSYVFMISS